MKSPPWSWRYKGGGSRKSNWRLMGYAEGVAAMAEAAREKAGELAGGDARQAPGA